tara:strand:- start:3966 stop:4244 length:279 start_codon:yes stop_codon:yes gene_type:complete
MSQKTSRFNQTDFNDLPDDLTALGRKLRTLEHSDKNELLKYYYKIISYSKRRTEIVNLLSDSLAQLRLDAKYLSFDLEITRDERDEALAQLE